MIAELFFESSVNEADYGIGIRKLDKFLKDQTDWQVTKFKGIKRGGYAPATVNRRELYNQHHNITVYLTSITQKGFDTRTSLTTDKRGWKAEGQVFYAPSDLHSLERTLTQIIKEEGSSKPGPKAMTDREFKSIMKDYKNVAKDFEADGMEFDDSVAFEVAGNILREHPSMEAYINRNKGASDAIGWLANQL